jgi:sulfide:quinone oxidoreductase
VQSRASITRSAHLDPACEQDRPRIAPSDIGIAARLAIRTLAGEPAPETGVAMPRIVIAGGGIAGLEALVALRAHLGAEPEIELLDANADLVERQQAVAGPFTAGAVPHFSLGRIAADHDAELRRDRLASVDPEARRARTVAGASLQYDALLVAVGGRPDVGVPGALTFAGPRDVPAYRQLLGDLEARRIVRLGFAVPEHVSWALPLYELALSTAEHVRPTRGEDVGLVVVTPEHGPLEAFGDRIASQMWSMLAARDIQVVTDTVPLRTGPGGLVVAHAQPVQVERVVALARLGGPSVDGLPRDAHGFIPTDEHGVVPGVEAVWAAGDATTSPIKQGGLAADQADAAAASIARSLGAGVVPKPFRPVLRGLMLDPHGARFLDSRRGDLSSTPLWWPPTKVSARYLSSYLAPARTRVAPPSGIS